MVAARLTFVITHPRLEVPPLPLYSTLGGHGVGWTVVFDQQLQDAVCTPANFVVTHALNDKTIVTAGATLNEARLTGVADVGFTPPNGIAYLGTPQELIGISGLPVAPFAKVPFI